MTFLQLSVRVLYKLAHLSVMKALYFEMAGRESQTERDTPRAEQGPCRIEASISLGRATSSMEPRQPPLLLACLLPKAPSRYQLTHLQHHHIISADHEREGIVISLYCTCYTLHNIGAVQRLRSSCLCLCVAPPRLPFPNFQSSRSGLPEASNTIERLNVELTSLQETKLSTHCAISSRLRRKQDSIVSIHASLVAPHRFVPEIVQYKRHTLYELQGSTREHT